MTLFLFPVAWEIQIFIMMFEEMGNVKAFGKHPFPKSWQQNFVCSWRDVFTWGFTIGEEPAFCQLVPIILEPKKCDEDRMANTPMLWLCYVSYSVGSGFRRPCTRCRKLPHSHGPWAQDSLPQPLNALNVRLSHLEWVRNYKFIWFSGSNFCSSLEGAESSFSFPNWAPRQEVSPCWKDWGSSSLPRPGTSPRHCFRSQSPVMWAEMPWAMPSTKLTIFPCPFLKPVPALGDLPNLLGCSHQPSPPTPGWDVPPLWSGRSSSCLVSSSLLIHGRHIPQAVILLAWFFIGKPIIKKWFFSPLRRWCFGKSTVFSYQIVSCLGMGSKISRNH